MSKRIGPTLEILSDSRRTHAIIARSSSDFYSPEAIDFVSQHDMIDERLGSGPRGQSKSHMKRNEMDPELKETMESLTARCEALRGSL